MKIIVFAALAAMAVPVCASAQTDVWQFDEAGGSTAVNGVSGRPDGTLSPGAVRVAGLSGNAVYTPPGEKVDFTTATGQFGSGDFTVSFWVNTTNASHAEMLGNRGAFGSHGSYVDFRTRADGRMTLEISGDTGGTGYIALTSAAVINDGNWHRVVGVRAGATATLYVDGVLQATQSAAGQIVAHIQSPFAFTAGANENSFNYNIFFNGSFDEVTLYDWALTSFDLASPLDKLTSIQGTVQGYGLEAGIANSLNAKLTAALADAASGDVQGAAGVLGALANQVSAQRGKKLTEAQATELLALIDATLASL